MCAVRFIEHALHLLDLFHQGLDGAFGLGQGLEDRWETMHWVDWYNEDRPHSAIGYNVPIAMHYPDGVTSPSS